MKNRQKLTDDQLDVVSGGTYESAENEKKINQMICPLCANRLASHKTETRISMACTSCGTSWTQFNGHWEKDVKSSGC